MKRTALIILVVALLGLGLAQILPWWSIAIAGMAAGWFLRGNRGRSFFGGFLGGWLLWAGAAMGITLTTGSDLADKFSTLMGFGGNGMILALISGVIAGLVAGFAAFTGDSLRQIQDRG
ncbi:MAG: hypothetical protein U0176_11455 [Bacteroidia bacterium]